MENHDTGLGIAVVVFLAAAAVVFFETRLIVCGHAFRATEKDHAALLTGVRSP
jgi:hypothetical protein